MTYISICSTAKSPLFTISALSPFINPKLPEPFNLTMDLGRKKSRHMNPMRSPGMKKGTGSLALTLGGKIAAAYI